MLTTPSPRDPGRKTDSVFENTNGASDRKSKIFLYFERNLPLSLSRIANRIVYVCSMLVKFQPVYIPPPVTSPEEMSVEEYFASLCDEDSE